MKKLILFLIAATLVACKNDPKPETDANADTDTLAVAEDEKFRPQFHFTPEANWMNDPNGMFFLDGTYHLYFQYYPEDNIWGPMHWGHATSKDMISWEEQGIALEPDEKGYIFSGSAVVDRENTSGFGKDSIAPVIAIYTYHDPEGAEKGKIDYQSQAIAYSMDKGQTWTKFDGNPVIPNPGIENFRDPKVMRDTVNDQWLMALATTEKTLFYASSDLKKWKKLSEFGEGTGAHNGVWECPDFFPMKVEDTGEQKWVLIQSLNPGGYNGGSGTQYFVGDWDGKTFTPEENMENLEEKHSYWLDFGRDNYAGVTWSNIKDGRTLFMGWMSNWLYAQEVPTTTWRSAMTVARELVLSKKDGNYRIYSKPVEELSNYTAPLNSSLNTSEKGVFTYSPESELQSNRFKIEIPIKDQKKIEFRIGNEQDSLIFGLNIPDKQFYVNRRNSGLTDFKKNFAEKISTAPRIANNDTLVVDLVIDKTSVEIFYDEGATVMTEIFFPEKPYKKLSIHSEMPPSQFEALKIETKK